MLPHWQNLWSPFTTGPIAIFNSAILSWRVATLFDINQRSLALFSVMDPLPEIVLVGYGSPLVSMTKPSGIGDTYEDEEEEERRWGIYRQEQAMFKQAHTHMAKVTLAMKAQGVTVVFMPTDKAVATYNWLVYEDRLAACAALPPSVVPTNSDESDMQHNIDVHKIADTKLHTWKWLVRKEKICHETRQPL